MSFVVTVPKTTIADWLGKRPDRALYPLKHFFPTYDGPHSVVRVGTFRAAVDGVATPDVRLEIMADQHVLVLGEPDETPTLTIDLTGQVRG